VPKGLHSGSLFLRSLTCIQSASYKTETAAQSKRYPLLTIKASKRPFSNLSTYIASSLQTFCSPCMLRAYIYFAEGVTRRFFSTRGTKEPQTAARRYNHSWGHAAYMLHGNIFTRRIHGILSSFPLRQHIKYL
jgi:hypothetical protein